MPATSGLFPRLLGLHSTTGGSMPFIMPGNSMASALVFRILVIPDFRLSGFSTSMKPGIPNSGFPKLRIFGNPDVRISGFLNSRVSALPEFRKSEFGEFRIPETRIPVINGRLLGFSPDYWASHPTTGLCTRLLGFALDYWALSARTGLFTRLLGFATDD